jgi:hypothetical protein
MVRALTTPESKPVWLLPGLWSLNAPAVAMAWLYVFAKVWRVDYLPWTAYAALALAVWVSHVATRLLDSKSRERAGRALAARHRLILRCRRCFLVALGLASAGLLGLVVLALPVSVFHYLTVGVVLVVGFFVIVAVGGAGGEEMSYGRNLLAGAAFAYGTTLVAHVFLPALGIRELLISREFLTFLLLCVLYFCAIDFWDIPVAKNGEESGAPGDLALTIPIVVLALAAVGFAVASQNETLRPFYYAILTAVALVYAINRNRHRWDADRARVLADVAMLVPALVFHAYASA